MTLLLHVNRMVQLVCCELSLPYPPNVPWINTSHSVKTDKQINAMAFY